MMCEVALIVTGELERRGLAQALQRVFPQARFRVEMKLDSFTSARVQRQVRAPVPRLVDKLAAALVATVDPGRRSSPADFALVVEDLELVNLDQPGMVVDEFRDAVVRHVERQWPSEDRRRRARSRLQEAASFHLLSPMIEAYFFGEPKALTAAGVTRVPLLAPGVDLEQFCVLDRGYLEAPDGSTSWAVPRRRQHPKHYLQYLIDPTHPPKTRYREAVQGLRALDTINMRELVQPAPEHLQFARSLLHDLAEALGQSLPISGSLHPETARNPQVLRNA